jgi:hypothetical protein
MRENKMCCIDWTKEQDEIYDDYEIGYHEFVEKFPELGEYLTKIYGKYPKYDEESTLKSKFFKSNIFVAPTR